MPDSTNARWDADQQGWVTGTPPESAGGEAPRQLNIPAPVLVFLVVLLVVLAVVAAVGINAGPAEESSSSDAASASPGDGAGTADSSDSESASAEDEADTEEPSAEESPGESSGAEDPFAEEDVESQAPDGYELSTDSGWFELNVPEGWQHAGDGAQKEVFYDPEDPRYFLQITSMQDVHASPWAAMNALEAELQGEYEQFDYDDYGGAAVLEEDPSVMQLNYRYDHDTFGRQDVYVRTFRGGDGEIYAVSAEGAADFYERTQERCEEAATSFCVTGDDCS
ncbi:hypothetical protein ACIRPH_09060 [Nocardiopsis sp. NPDC101807]|uniref:hypothetical protein n=1 Tax=Nocardiopsis sp. NPDC101807 TaxID=3364339 RepID=UPI003830CA5D